MSTLDAVQRVKAQGPVDANERLRQEAFTPSGQSQALSPASESLSDSCSAAPPVSTEPQFSGKEPYGGFQLLYHHLWNDLARSYYDKTRDQQIKSLEHKYDDKISTLADLDLALQLMAESVGDRYTWYAGAGEIKKNTEDAKSLKSAGLELHKHGDHFELDDIYYKSAAYNNSVLHEHDRVKCINDVPLDTLTNKEANRLLKGKEGSLIKIKAQSHETGKAYDTELKISDIPKPAIESQLIEGRFVHVRFPTFMEEGRVTEYANLARFVEHVSSQAALAGGKPEGIILDLRNNLGGDTEEAILFSSLFLKPEQLITQLEQRSGTQLRKVVDDSQLVFEGKPIDPQILKLLRETPLVVLGNGSSASSSELTIAALQDNKRAKFIGEQSFGKGVGYKVVLSQMGGNLSITNLRYRSPDGKDINGKGLTPDIEVKKGAGTMGLDSQLATAVLELKKTSKN